MLAEKGIEPVDNICYAWMPSITKLSRQALFRGDMPRDSYVQNPKNESKLWFDYWKNGKFLSQQYGMNIMVP